MDILNDTPFQEGLAIGMGPDRQAHLAVIVKCTYRLPDGVDGALVQGDDQLPVVTGDEFVDGDVLGSLLYDAENYVFKPRADVAVVGHAYAPAGRPVKALNVALRVGRHEWARRVTGDRQWLFPSRAVLVPLISDPKPFTAIPLRYERSYGGFDHRGRSWCKENPIGRGFIARKTRESVHESFLPNFEDPLNLITSWDDRPPPAGFGMTRRDWYPRAGLMGSRMDTAHEEFGLPGDFDHAYYNAAHPDLQVPYLRGDEEVEMQHLTPDGYRRFKLPGWRPTVSLDLFTDGKTWEEVLAEAVDAPPERPTTPEELAMRLDTLVLLPDDGLLYLVWRGNRPVKSLDLGEVAAIRIEN
jgi:hypothetical protein